METTGMNPTFYIVIAYMAVMIAIALYVSFKKVKSSEDYHLAGRSLGPLMMAGTLAAAEIGGGSTIGVAAKAYGSWGLSAGWYVVCAGIGIFLVSFVAPFLRRSMATTVPEIIGRRYGTPAHIITTFLSLCTLFVATAAQIQATSAIIETISGGDFVTVTIMVAIVVTLYTMLGGLVSVAFTDIVHILFITVGMAIAMPIILQGAGGWETVSANIAATAPQKLGLTEVGWKTIIGLILMYFMTFSTGQEAVQRYFAARDIKTARLGSFLCSALMALYGFIPAIIGLCALAHFPDIKATQAMPMAAMKFAPIMIAGLVMASVVAATMSSASGNLIASCTLFTKDVYQKYVNPNASDKTILFLSKAVVVVMGASCLIIALNPAIGIIELLVFGFTMRSAGPFAAFIFGFVYKNATVHGGLAAIIGGSIAAGVWQYYGEPYGVMSLVFGSIVSTILFFTVSKIERSMGVPAAPPAISAENIEQNRLSELR
ncbi:sodium:solute symporter family protein [Desulfovibrio litoralis]|uniref:Solute:Na+ symporter, SSS family n=1 Tax=Desulfovibrio litoralis DSM 11393 TaxID=1121455 RepID=A0A1M7S966_9BACT|nr:sodium:solute symporter family protein [Desulfovibrio litoralis]SHN55021.1 solute:Na+ symporter, SSS family [Desulfovibrio litoralis DSM 11393]